VYADEQGPSERQRTLFLELQRRYAEVKQIIEKPLADEYEAIRISWKLTSQPLETASEIWKLAGLCRVEINWELHNNGDLVLDHSLDWVAEHALFVVIRDWQVTEVKLAG
jgi:hypothetical protein